MSGYQVKKVVVPIDFSDDSYAAVDTALQACVRPSDVHVVHVLPELNLSEPGVVWQTIDHEVRSQHAIEVIRERLSEEKYQPIQIDVEIGDPGYRIADFAERSGAELIVMSSHGRAGVVQMFIGSVTERVLRMSHCPVLVLKK